MNITPSEIKALENGEIKIILNNLDDYRKCRKPLNDVNNIEIKKTVGTVKYHTYRPTFRKQTILRVHSWITSLNRGK